MAAQGPGSGSLSRPEAALACHPTSAWPLSQLQPSSITQYKDIKLFMTAESRILLHGVTIDFVDSPSQTGLVFRQPPGTNTCSKN